jgi:hypothetical protein
MREKSNIYIYKLERYTEAKTNLEQYTKWIRIANVSEGYLRRVGLSGMHGIL